MQGCPLSVVRLAASGHQIDAPKKAGVNRTNNGAQTNPVARRTAAAPKRAVARKKDAVSRTNSGAQTNPVAPRTAAAPKRAGRFAIRKSHQDRVVLRHCTKHGYPAQETHSVDLTIA